MSRIAPANEIGSAAPTPTGTYLAYQSRGTGPRPVVTAAGVAAVLLGLVGLVGQGTVLYDSLEWNLTLLGGAEVELSERVFAASELTTMSCRLAGAGLLAATGLRVLLRRGRALRWLIAYAVFEVFAQLASLAPSALYHATHPDLGGTWANWLMLTGYAGSTLLILGLFVALLRSTAADDLLDRPTVTPPGQH